MSIIEDISTLNLDQLEDAEKLTTQWVFQAMLDFGMESYQIFRSSPDDVKDIAEDVTREALDRLPGFNVQQRIYGTVDYKRARYLIFPEGIVRQALFIDSKAEKTDRNATIQMSQTSMHVKQVRQFVSVDIPGSLPMISVYADKQYLTTTVFLHFTYQDANRTHELKKLTIVCLPNGRLQQLYNPDANDNIWQAGRNAPTLGELFRARLSFSKLANKSLWRVQTIIYDIVSNACQGIWRG